MLPGTRPGPSPTTNDLCDHRRVKAERFLDAQAGQETTVLVERKDRGYSEHFAPVQLSEPAPEGTLVRARIDRRDGAKLVGKAVRRAA